MGQVYRQHSDQILLNIAKHVGATETVADSCEASSSKKIRSTGISRGKCCVQCCIICERDDDQSNLRKMATDKVAKLNNNVQLLGKLIGQRWWYFLSCPMLHTSSRHSTHFKDRLLSLLPE